MRVLNKKSFCQYPLLRSSFLSKMAQKVPTIVKVLASSVGIASHAGKIVRDVLSAGDLGIVEKGKNDLQTEADRAAQRFIISSLAKQFPSICIIGEEGTSEIDDPLAVSESVQDSEVLKIQCPKDLTNVSDDQICVWVDPLDGTSEFTQGLLDHVTVLIGVAVGKEAVAGVIHQPFYNYQSKGELGRTVWGLRGAGVGGLKKPVLPDGVIITTTRSHSTGLVNEVLEACQPNSVLRVGGAGHKVMLLMEGKAHAYIFASGGSKRWDTCAPEAVLRELGGELTDMYGNRYDYDMNTPHPNSRGVLATARLSDHPTYVSKTAPLVTGKL